MAQHHILIGIDGTGSTEWRRQDGLNSHVYRFVNDFVGDKVYLNGPGKLGLEVGNIIDEAVRETYYRVARILKFEGCKIDDIKINIVGHSRGGFIALKLATVLSNSMSFIRPAAAGSADRAKFHKRYITSEATLTQPNINFIGLYDAVKRTPTEVEGNLTLTGTKIAHAYRKITPYLNSTLQSSRPTFHGMMIPNAVLIDLDTSHGGIGGDPGFFDPIKFGNDLYCNALDLILGERSFLKILTEPISSVYAAAWLRHREENKDARIDQTRNYWKRSIQADLFIREQARSCGVKLIGNCDHVPWLEKDHSMGVVLKRMLRM
ncbi:hypothetical protein LZD49_31705 [Dyadobacter sp. CY261]|uniref:hypothetical protein n=1 Tax=Dyadobacter sp. CY261 TaxID=2907203 RepID=UPI001F3A26A8|nr:hypothetical protein [Dyadobacter sp. CY261]MCF0075093.1 hypothetical protein [Dyadobacter sp. CY261]